MKQEADLISARLKTPRAAAIAGIVFSVLMISGLLLLRISIQGNPLEADTWLKTSSGTLVRTLYMVPFAGIAFLWFIGVIRDRLGELEDQCFATVFLGSGLLFVAMLFASAAVTGDGEGLPKAHEIFGLKLRQDNTGKAIYAYIFS